MASTGTFPTSSNHSFAALDGAGVRRFFGASEPARIRRTKINFDARGGPVLLSRDEERIDRIARQHARQNAQQVTLAVTVASEQDIDVGAQGPGQVAEKTATGSDEARHDQPAPAVSLEGVLRTVSSVCSIWASASFSAIELRSGVVLLATSDSNVDDGRQRRGTAHPLGGCSRAADERRRDIGPLAAPASQKPDPRPRRRPRPQHPQEAPRRRFPEARGVLGAGGVFSKGLVSYTKSWFGTAG